MAMDGGVAVSTHHKPELGLQESPDLARSHSATHGSCMQEMRVVAPSSALHQRLQVISKQVARVTGSPVAVSLVRSLHAQVCIRPTHAPARLWGAHTC